LAQAAIDAATGAETALNTATDAKNQALAAHSNAFEADAQDSEIQAAAQTANGHADDAEEAATTAAQRRDASEAANTAARVRTTLLINSAAAAAGARQDAEDAIVAAAQARTAANEVAAEVQSRASNPLRIVFNAANTAQQIAKSAELAAIAAWEGTLDKSTLYFRSGFFQIKLAQGFVALEPYTPIGSMAFTLILYKNNITPISMDVAEKLVIVSNMAVHPSVVANLLDGAYQIPEAPPESMSDNGMHITFIQAVPPNRYDYNLGSLSSDYGSIPQNDQHSNLFKSTAATSDAALAVSEAKTVLYSADVALEAARLALSAVEGLGTTTLTDTLTSD
jgi:hypothetical protein